MSNINGNLPHRGQFGISMTSYGSVEYSTNTLDEITIDQGINWIPFGRYHVLIFIAVMVSFMSFAIQTLLVPVIGSTFGCSMELTSTELASVSTVYFVGQLLGTLPFGRFLDQLGRKPACMYLATSVLFYAGIFSIVPSFYWSLIVRFLCGVVAIAVHTAFLVLAIESLHIKWRLVVIGIRAVTFGITSITLNGIAVSILSSYSIYLGWRMVAAIVVTPTLITVVLCLFLVESPRFYMSKQDTESAGQCLQRIAEINGTPFPPFKIKPTENTPVKPKAFIRDLVANGRYRTTLPLMAMWFSTAFTYYGILTSTGYLITLHDADDQPTTSPQLSADITGIGCGSSDHTTCSVPTKDELISILITSSGELASCITTIGFIYCFGRTRAYACTLLLSFIFVIVAIIGVGRFDLTFIVLAIRGFTAGGMAALFLYTLEIYPTNIRGTALLVGEAVGGVGAAISPFIAQDYLPQNTIEALTIFAVLAFGSGCCSLVLVQNKGDELKDS